MFVESGMTERLDELYSGDHDFLNLERKKYTSMDLHDAAPATAYS